MKLRVVVALALAVPFLFLDRAAQAQMSDNEKKAAARAAYTEGVELQDKGKYAEALADFEKAEKLFDAPTHLLHIAECQAQLGKLVEASETYEILTRKTLEPNAPDAFKQAQTQGGKELETLRPRIPTLRVNVKPEPGTLSNLQISVNDKTMPVEAIGIARPINPGAYKITATATGFGTKAPTEIDVKEKDAKTVDLTLEKGATGGATTTTPHGPEKPVDMTGPSPFGLLIGARPLAFIPFGKVDGETDFKQYAGAGAGVGVDLAGRISQRFLVGGSAEIALMRGPDRFVPADKRVLPDAAGGGVKANVSAISEYIGVFGGFMYDVDKVTPVGILHGGYRFIQRQVDLAPVGPGKAISFTDDVNGIQVGLHAGVSIPLGPMRVVPLLDFSGGQIGERACKSASELGVGPATATNCTNAGSGVFVMAGLSVGIYYHLDFGRGKTGGAGAIGKMTRPTF